MGSRSTARRVAMQAIYQSDVSSVDIEEALDGLFKEEKMTDEARDFSKKLAIGVIKAKDELDGRIKDFSKNWTVDRISPVDRSILRIALFELIHEKDTPRAVIINEAIELAKRYSDENSASFINGILGAAVV